jgi:hypothetical protein
MKRTITLLRKVLIIYFLSRGLFFNVNWPRIIQYRTLPPISQVLQVEEPESIRIDSIPGQFLSPKSECSLLYRWIHRHRNDALRVQRYLVPVNIFGICFAGNYLISAHVKLGSFDAFHAKNIVCRQPLSFTQLALIPLKQNLSPAESSDTSLKR